MSDFANAAMRETQREIEGLRADVEMHIQIASDIASDNGRLRASNAELVGALEETMSWINGWDPPFTHDDEWPATKAKVRAALANAKE